MRILVPIPGRINQPGRLALGRNDSMMQGCSGNGTVNSPLHSQFAQFIGIWQFPFNCFVTDVTRRVLGCP